MTGTQAAKEMRKLFREGKTHIDISEKLKADGFKGRRGPLTPAGVSYKLLSLGLRSRGTKKSGKKTATRVRSNCVIAVRSILNLKEMAADEKVALALLVIGGVND